MVVTIKHDYMRKINWHKTISRRETPIRAELLGRGSAKYVVRLLGTPNDNFLFLYDHGQGSTYFDPAQVQAMGTRVAQQVNNEPDFLKKHTDMLLRRCIDLVATSQKIGSQNLKTLPFPQLSNLFEQFIEVHFLFSPYMMIAVAVERVVTQLIREKLLTNLLINDDMSKLDVYLAKLYQTDKIPEVLKEQADFLKLQQKIKKDKHSNRQKLLKDHWQKYRWLSVYSPSDEPYSIEYFKEKLKSSDIPTPQVSKIPYDPHEFDLTITQLNPDKKNSFAHTFPKGIYVFTDIQGRTIM